MNKRWVIVVGSRIEPMPRRRIISDVTNGKDVDNNNTKNSRPVIVIIVYCSQFQSLFSCFFVIFLATELFSMVNMYLVMPLFIES